MEQVFRSIADVLNLADRCPGNEPGEIRLPGKKRISAMRIMAIVAAGQRRAAAAAPVGAPPPESRAILQLFQKPLW